MAGDAKKLQPIIIKRVRKGGHNKHGGAWKIAYADFVTAMMAFFLLMWLLGSTTEGDKKGIADFFNAPLKVALLGGSGAGDSSHVVRGGGADLSRTTGQVKEGDVPAKRKLLNIKSLEAEQKRAEIARLEALKKKVEDALSASPKLAAMKSQIRLDMTRDGLRIQIVDEQNRPMFDSGSADREAVHARAAARDRPRALGRAEPDHARRPHRLAAVQRRRARLQQLGALDRPRQRVAARDRRRRPARGPHAAGPGAGVEQPVRRPPSRPAR